MSSAERLVLDTNVIVSGLLFPGLTPSRALQKAQTGDVLASDETLLELVEVMGRPKFDRFVERSIRQQLVAEFANAIQTVQISTPIRACRDPRDDKFLEVAVHGQADAIVTGDADLLALHPFRGIAILTPADYLDRESSAAPHVIL
jgi:putative PIN family toxin of toxin-antitoxin system